MGAHHCATSVVVLGLKVGRALGAGSGPERASGSGEFVSWPILLIEYLSASS